jgi:hypothetical protein
MRSGGAMAGAGEDVDFGGAVLVGADWVAM